MSKLKTWLWENPLTAFIFGLIGVGVLAGVIFWSDDRNRLALGAVGPLKPGQHVFEVYIGAPTPLAIEHLRARKFVVTGEVRDSSCGDVATVAGDRILVFDDLEHGGDGGCLIDRRGRIAALEFQSGNWP